MSLFRVPTFLRLQKPKLDSQALCTYTVNLYLGSCVELIENVATFKYAPVGSEGVTLLQPGYQL